MKCPEFKFMLPLYSDDLLSADERSRLDAHLVTCPLCRQTLSEHHEVHAELRSVSRPPIPSGVLGTTRALMAARLGKTTDGPNFGLVGPTDSWIDRWLMPYAVGSVTSVILTFTFLWIILAGAPRPEYAANLSAVPSNYSTQRPISTADYTSLSHLTPAEYANSRLAISKESPSINPRGALIALTRSLMRGEMNDDEVVIVADVFGNGLARIAEVVERPAGDDAAIIELQKALQSDPNFAPFVPAKMDGRSETTRVVIRFQSVNVNTSPY